MSTDNPQSPTADSPRASVSRLSSDSLRILEWYRERYPDAPPFFSMFGDTLIVDEAALLFSQVPLTPLPVRRLAPVSECSVAELEGEAQCLARLAEAQDVPAAAQEAYASRLEAIRAELAARRGQPSTRCSASPHVGAGTPSLS